MSGGLLAAGRALRRIAVDDRPSLIKRCSQVILLLAVVSAGAPANQYSSAMEYKIKAAYLYNFAKFVEWPASAFRRPDSPLLVCVTSGNPFGRALYDIAQGRTAQGRELKVYVGPNSRELDACHILFVDEADGGLALEHLGGTDRTGVLTVADRQRIARRGAIIVFSTEAGTVQFTINLSAARDAQIKISSQLLKVARVVRDEEGSKDARLSQHSY